jgi:hypothetical protein
MKQPLPDQAFHQPGVSTPTEKPAPVSHDTSDQKNQPIVPDYDLLRRIGGGAYGEVWLARSKEVQSALPSADEPKTESQSKRS